MIFAILVGAAIVLAIRYRRTKSTWYRFFRVSHDVPAIAPAGYPYRSASTGAYTETRWELQPVSSPEAWFADHAPPASEGWRPIPSPPWRGYPLSPESYLNAPPRLRLVK